MKDDANLVETAPRSVWHGWGDPQLKKELSPLVWRGLKLAKGIEPAEQDTPPVALDDVELPASTLDDDDLAALRTLVGDAHVSVERRERIEHAGGKSYPDLYRLRTGDGSHAPDAVVFPADGSEVVEVLRLAAQREIAVVPFGGGTSVVGGVDPVRGRFASVISLDLRRLDAVVSIDETSRTATLQPGLRGAQLEAVLRPRGLTLGHFPQSYEQATLGGYLVTRSSGQASSGYGRFEQNVVAVTLATPEGELTLGGRTPSSATAAGPKLIDVLIGSEGTLGVITEMTLQLHEGPTEFAYETWAFDSFTDGFDAFRALAQDLGHGVMPDVSRLSDGEESRTILAQSARGLAAMATFAARGAREPSLGGLRWEDTDRTTLRRRRRQAHRVLRAAGARRAPASIAEHWISHRFRGPYQRDHLMDRGIFVETLETATTWANLPTLYSAVRDAISAEVGPHAVVQCHVSHLYDGGASLYYTFFCREESDPLAQWRRVKTAASDVIAAHGGTITHHHAVGTDHRAWAADEMGELGARILRAVKNELDPAGILNPGKLVPPVDDVPDACEAGAS